MPWKEVRVNIVSAFFSLVLIVFFVTIDRDCFLIVCNYIKIKNHKRDRHQIMTRLNYNHLTMNKSKNGYGIGKKEELS